MNKRQIERYFVELARIYPKKCMVVLTGAAAGVLYGRVRATMDIDFSARTRNWDAFAEAVSKISARTAIEAQYAQDIDRWSPITLMNYQKHSFLHKRFGSIEVRLMEPAFWAIGKLSRYLDSDTRDLVNVFKKMKTPWREVASVAGRALRLSPKSTACFLFRLQTDDFFKRFGKKIWGKRFNEKDAVTLFHKTAGVE
ncbi:MAG: hypothetical protein HYU33_07090 [Candidatus Omnitrophica bacterium]|nr:hypothetical protein [Candidatus Omnitrophota bacterium]